MSERVVRVHVRCGHHEDSLPSIADEVNGMEPGREGVDRLGERYRDDADPQTLLISFVR